MLRNVYWAFTAIVLTAPVGVIGLPVQPRDPVLLMAQRDQLIDSASFIEGMPMNLPTNAHGQGYSNNHLLLPELIGEHDKARPSRRGGTVRRSPLPAAAGCT